MWCAPVQIAVFIACFALPGRSQSEDGLSNKQRIARIRDLGKRKADAIPALSAYLKDPEKDIRLEAIRAIIRIGGDASLDPLVAATHDNDADVQIRAVDGLVNAYLPGYVAQGLTGPITRGVRQVKSLMFTRNDQIIDATVNVRPDVQEAVAALVSGGSSTDSRFTAARAAGILRDRAAVPALAGSLRAHDSGLIFECLVALQKIKPKTDLPSLSSASHDLDERTQILALETIGILHSTSSAPDVREALKNARNIRVERAALEALAMLSEGEDRAVFQKYTERSDAQLRASALEGLGRLREPEDYPVLERSYNEQDADWRVHLAAAFGLVDQGKLDTSDYSPLPYLVENLSMKSRTGVASAYLAELVHREDVRKALIPLVAQTSRDGKLALCSVLGETGSDEVEPVLQSLTRDADPSVATAAARGLRILKARQAS